MKIAYGKSRMEKRWKNTELTGDHFCKMVSTQQPTTETDGKSRKTT